MDRSLSSEVLCQLPRGLAPLPYDRSETSIGIVHFGPGGFHRAHQAAYTDSILSIDPSWAICGVSLRSSNLRDAISRQDNLYTLAILDEKTEYRLIGAIKELLVAPENPDAVLTKLTDKDVRIVTATITEKGYCLTLGGDLDMEHHDIIHDLSNSSSPRTFIGYIVEGLRRRREAGFAPFIPISCDNLAENGKHLKKSVLQFANIVDPKLATWIESKVAFPCTMVDSITPATDDSLRNQVNSDLGITDKWPISREPFTQWVIEDVFANYPVPPWDQVGVTFTQDVRPYEEAKLRLLNGCHSALAYIGTLAGEETVAGAMALPEISTYITQMMREEICPGLGAPDGMELETYCQAIRDRFTNPNIEYRLSQIAGDSSQKIPFRLLQTIEDNLNKGRSIKLLSLAVAAWMGFCIRAVQNNLPINDPVKDQILAIACNTTGNAEHDVSLFLELEEMFPTQLSTKFGFKESLTAAYEALTEGNRQSLLSSLTGEYD
ncbi:MAG: mannitol dehydrogenase [Alphaproteobacteria bacterium]|nr:MAG: mannitol dehydrogenase [Alphaproteobacteria bacterium]